LAVAVTLHCQSARAQSRRDVRSSFLWTYGSYVAAVCIAGLAAFPDIDRWHDLGQLARQVHHDTQQCELALLTPDETTIAMLDDRLRTPFTALTTDSASPGQPGSTPERLVSDWFKAHGTTGCVLVLLPGHASGELTRLLEHIHPVKPPGDGLVAELESQRIASVLRRYELPQGRRYALLGPPDAHGKMQTAATHGQPDRGHS
jgi:hypothetical protein